MLSTPRLLIRSRVASRSASPGNHYKLRGRMRPANSRKCSNEPIVSLDHAEVCKQPVLPGWMKKCHSIVRWPNFAMAMPKFDKPFFVKCVRKGRKSICRDAETPSCLHAIQIGDKYMVSAQKDGCRQSSRSVVLERDCSQGAVLVGYIGLFGQQRPRAIRRICLNDIEISKEPLAGPANELDSRKNLSRWAPIDVEYGLSSRSRSVSSGGSVLRPLKHVLSTTSAAPAIR